MTRAGWASFAAPSGALDLRAGSDEAVIRQLSIPMEILNENRRLEHINYLKNMIQMLEQEGAEGSKRQLSKIKMAVSV
jgi:hypothetical protein